MLVFFPTNAKAERVSFPPTLVTYSQRLHSTQSDFISAYCNAQAPHVSHVLWQQTANIRTVKLSGRAVLICDAIWQAF